MAMSGRLRTWAATGQYPDEGEPQQERPGGRASRSPGWQEHARLAALVPVGIVLGSLFALAFAVRLITAPLPRRSEYDPDWDEYIGGA
jgi:preprotein translocase subunit Sss1